MIILEFDSELNTNVGAYKILHLLTKNENLCLKGQRVMKFSSTQLQCCKESDARSLRGGGGELGKLKTLSYGFTTFSQSKLEHTV
jgi:hypothetical protein